MSNLYNVQLKIGGRSHNIDLYATDYNNILTFCQNNLQAKVVKIQQIVYDVRETATVPVDDKTTYQGTLYMLVRNATANLSRRIVLPTLKLGRNDMEVLNDMETFLKFNETLSIDSSISATIRSK